MITRITIDNFKLFNQSTDFTGLRPLNILTGVNGRGKSSFLQSLVLLNQSVAKNVWTDALLLDEDDIKLGTAADVKNSKRSSDEPIIFEYEFADHSAIRYKFSAADQQSQVLPIVGIERIKDDTIRVFDFSSKGPVHNFLPAFEGEMPEADYGIADKIQFISAERIGPKLNYVKKAKYEDGVTSDAANVVAVLYNHKDDYVSNAYINALEEVLPEEAWNEERDNTIRGQVELWLTNMFGYSRIHPEFVESANSYILSFNTDDSNRKFKATNVGYGYSYVLPILVAGLVAKPGGILIVENPESHLHPQAQSMVAKFLACIAATGVQVFIETHSEHILNGFRVLIAQKHLKNEEVSVKFFDAAYDDKYYKEIPIELSGKIEDWPRKFFDQEELDINVLINANIQSDDRYLSE